MKHPQAVLRMFMLSSVLTMLGYMWLVLPPSWTGTPTPAVVAIATGIGFSPCKLTLFCLTIIHGVRGLVLLVVLVPQLVPFKFVSTTLGVHKSVNCCSSSILSLPELDIPDGTNGRDDFSNYSRPCLRWLQWQGITPSRAHPSLTRRSV